MHLSLQDLTAVLGPMITLIGFMWYHFNNRIDRLEKKIDDVDTNLNNKIDSVEIRLNKKIDDVESRLNKKIDDVEIKLNKKIDEVESRLNKKIDDLDAKLSEKIDAVRDRVSRIEGQLVPTKIISFEEIRPREATEQKSARG